MKNDRFWKIIAIIAILLWIATLCTWYAVKTAQPRYVKSGSDVIDTKENKIYHPKYRKWVQIGIPFNVSPDTEDIRWQYIEEIIGCNQLDFEYINPDLSPSTIIDYFDQNKFTIQELKNAIDKFDSKQYESLITVEHDEVPSREDGIQLFLATRFGNVSDRKDDQSAYMEGIIRRRKAREYVTAHREEIIQSIDNVNIRELFKE